MNNKLKKIINILNIVILMFSLVWVSGFYISFISIIANRVIPRFSIYDVLFRVVSLANLVVVMSLILKYIKSKVTNKLLNCIVVTISFVIFIGLIISIFYFFKL
jgi:hypothetical protein